MRRTIIRIPNLFLSIFGAQIVSKSKASFDMFLALERIARHDIEISSIIDIGASNGKWSVKAIRVFPDASILAIEPLKERKKQLENLKRKYSNFDYDLCVAVEKDRQQVILNVSDDLDGSTVSGIGGEPRNIIVRSIDALVSERKLKSPFLLKFDTHGYELPILSGSRNTLKETNVVIMEVYNFKITAHSLRYHEMCLHMEDLGFRCYDIADPMLRIYDNAFWQMDILFCRKDSNIFSYAQYK